MTSKFQFLDTGFELSPVRRLKHLVLAIDDTETLVEERRGADGRCSYIVDGDEIEVFVARAGDTIFVHADGETWEVLAINPIEAAAVGGGGANAVRAPMPGVVVSIAVATGDTVSEGQALMVIESMKLQTSIVAERDGVIEAVCFDRDATFDKGDELLRYAETDEV